MSINFRDPAPLATNNKEDADQLETNFQRMLGYLRFQALTPTEIECLRSLIRLSYSLGRCRATIQSRDDLRDLSNKIRQI